ncbi:MAG TPA: hypothetical protein VJT74_05470, partial [Pyrinomonadaceae bacterium]|nr:hypothetical protein [Pyrinomonadaceae bacterium]
MNPSRRTKLLSRILVAGLGLMVVLLIVSFFAPEALARVGGGQSYGGGSRGGGGGSGEGAGFLIWLLFRLILLTFEYPAIGIPLDIIVVVVIILIYRSDGGKKQPSVCSADMASRPAKQRTFAQEFAQLRKFDPNFSEITFTDFCYALYARAHDARGRGRLDELSFYLSEEARNSLAQRNPPNLAAVTGVIIGSMQV